MWNDRQRIYKDSTFSWPEDGPRVVYVNVTVDDDGGVHWSAQIRNERANGLASTPVEGRTRALKALVLLAMLQDIESGRHGVWPEEITNHDLWREVAL